MTNNVTKVDVENKTAELSNPGKLLRAYMQATGVHCAKELADSLGIKLRTIQRLKLEIAMCANDAISGVSESAKRARYGAANSANDAINGVSQQSDGKKVSPTPPSKNNYNLETTVQPEPEREPDGWAELKAAFNGSTAAMVADVQAYLAPYGDKASAVKWLGGTVSAFGPSRTAQAWTMIVTKVARGEPIKNALPLWAKTANGLRDNPDAAQAALENPFAEQTKGVVRFAQPAQDDPAYLKNFGRRQPAEAARA